MKQRKYEAVIFLSMMALIMWSCQKTDINIDLKSNDWEVVKIKNQGEFSYSNAEESYILNFLNDSDFTINLDVNSCGGKYKSLSNGNIEFEELWCTEICCDSEFADDLIRLFPKMSNYYEKNNELIFEGQGEIILIPIIN